MAINLQSITGLNQQQTATELILKRGPIEKDKDGRITKGEYPNGYFEKTPGYFNKDATLANKDKIDLNYDFQHIRIQNRIIREATPDEQYTLDDLIEEFDREYSALNLDTMNKEGTNNNRRLINTNISENTNKTVDTTQQRQNTGFIQGLGALFRRR